MPSNVKIAYDYLRRREHLTPAQAAGVIGSMQGESGKGLNPAAVNPNGGATGIAQWLGGRKTAAVTSKRLMPQLRHISEELHGPESKALRSIKSAKTPEQAAIAWQRDFERGAPFEQKYDQRAANARNVFRQLGNSKITSLPSGGSQDSPDGTTVTRVTTPGITIGAGSRMVQDPDAQKRVILANLIKQRQPDSPLIKLGILDPNESTMVAANDPGVTIPGVTRTTRTTSGSLTGGPSGGSRGGRGKGVAKITGPNPGRIVPQVTNFMKEISSVRGGKPVVGSDGTGHSYLTVNGNVSEHSTGHASDIPATGQELTNLGQAALIAAGMPRAQARKQHGGLFNVMKGKRRYQIIFNTNEGGNHYTHLHVGVKG
jgi:hypothetical protein